MLPVLFATYGAVFVAEIVGDKLLYTTGVLATRYPTLPILCGMAVAFMAKMAVAVLVGKAISTLPPLVVAGWQANAPGESACTTYRDQSAGVRRRTASSGQYRRRA
jgi:putative Ca2+/H+ antiporter (TMEM165/GDT1 family)